MINFAPYPIPVIVEDGKEGYVLYIVDGGQYENDCWCVIHCDTGIVRHYTTDKIVIHQNLTYGIKK